MANGAITAGVLSAAQKLGTVVKTTARKGLDKALSIQVHMGFFPGFSFGPTHVRQCLVMNLGGIDFVPVDLGRLASMKAAADSVFGEFGLEVVDIAQHSFVPQTREPGELTRLDGEFAPRFLAGNAVGSIMVHLNGAETGDVHNYKNVKVLTDGIGTDGASRAKYIYGRHLLQNSMFARQVATEGTPSHPKPGEPAAGNPTIPIGKTHPPLRDLKRGGRRITVKHGIPDIEGLRPVNEGNDVIEGTELASTSPATFRAIAGKDKDNGACTVSFHADKWPGTADTYADKIAISPELVRALNERGAEISISVGGDPVETLKLLSEESGIPLEELGVIGLGTKPRYKEFDDDGQPIKSSLKHSRAGRQELLERIAGLGVKLKTIDDGETPAMTTLAKGNEITFDDGRTGKVHVFFGPGGAFESMTLASAIRDAGGDGWFCYVNKAKTKKRETYADRTELDERDLAEMQRLGIENPSRSRNISEVVPDGGDRMLVVTTFTRNPLNPQAMPVEVNEEDGTIVFYQEVFASDGSVRGLLWKLKARESLDHVREVLAPIIPNLMAMTDMEAMRDELTKIAKTPEGLAAIRSGLLSYLYYYVSENPERGPDFVLNDANLKKRALETDERRDFEFLLWVTQNYGDWFTNPNAVQEALTESGTP